MDKREKPKLPKLYKYRSFKECLVYSPGLTTPMAEWEHQLFAGVLCSSSPLWFNDPFDCEFSVEHNFLQNRAAKEILISILEESKPLTVQKKQSVFEAEDWKKEIENVSGESFSDDLEQELMGATNTSLRRAQKDFQVLCFSQTNESILMWSHYADNHKGFCIEYDFDKWSLSNCLHPVQYNAERYFIPGTFANGDAVVANREIYKAALHKAKEWEYEQEWRMVFMASQMGVLGEMAGKHAFVLSEFITGVYLGVKADQSFQEQICEHFKGTGVKVYRMKLKEDSYALEAEQVQ